MKSGRVATIHTKINIYIHKYIYFDEFAQKQHRNITGLYLLIVQRSL